jgi:hypothetical protein
MWIDRICLQRAADLSPRAAKWNRFGAYTQAAILLAAIGPLNAWSQLSADAIAGVRELPGGPGYGTPASSNDPMPTGQQATGVVAGTVYDLSGDVLQGAHVTLAGPDGTVLRETQSGINGDFRFEGLPASHYKLIVSGAGMGTFNVPDIPLLEGEVHTVPGIVLTLASTTTDVRVSADPVELSQEQVHIAVEQRVLGVLPNFYTTFDWNAPPMLARQKFQLAFRSATDPVAFLGAGVLAGIQHAKNSYPGYGQEELGYTKRFGAAYANDMSGRMLSSAIFPSLFHQDPRYFYHGTGSKPRRAFYAISAAVIAKGDNGRWQPNYSHVLGSFAAGGISNLYYPAASRGFSLTMVNGLIETAGNAGNNLLREFVLKGLTTKVPSYANGKP